MYSDKGKFEDENFMNSKVTVKSMKFVSLVNTGFLRIFLTK